MRQWNKAEQIGRLTERVTIEQVSEAQSASGFPVPTWSTLATVWASVNYRAGGSDEDQDAGRQVATGAVRFTMRYRSDVTEKMRIVHDSYNYDILSILPDEDGAFMVIEAKKRV